ncbi:MAG: AMP-binding protein [Candidatus Nomurabacteria bacterium]|jgi:long-chain acyl-CoA synthetase|nr:AMP-binding protein [Candidatus Nomurabacteria bacterium]
MKVKTPWYDSYKGMRKHLRYPNHSLYTQLREAIKKYPDNVALKYFNKDTTYEQLDIKIRRCSHALIANGVRPGDVVTICMPNTPECVIMFYALNRIGAVASIIHPLAAENEIKRYLEISDSKMILVINVALEKIENIISDTRVFKVIVVTPSDSMPIVKKTAYNQTVARLSNKVKESARFTSWKKFMRSAEEYTGKINEKVVGRDVACILYSGGTTGEPKGILLTNKGINAISIQAVEAIGNLSDQDSLLAILPMFHGFGLAIGVHTTLCLGATDVLIPQFSVNTFHRLLNKYEPTVIVGVPTLFEALLKNKHMKNIDLSYLRHIICGGDSLSVGLKKRTDAFLHEHGCFEQVREGYGLTETVTACTVMPTGQYRENSIGLPFPDVYVKIVKPYTQVEVAYGEVGEICVATVGMMVGYLNDELETARVLQRHRDGMLWLHTGDLGTMDKDGFTYFKQRLKRMIISSGYNVYPQFIENIIDEFDGVLMSTVIGVPDAYRGMAPKAFVVLKNKVKPNESFKRALREHCRKNLAKYEMPTRFVFKKSLPKTLVGKVNYRELEKE